MAREAPQMRHEGLGVDFVERFGPEQNSPNKRGCFTGLGRVAASTS